MNNKNIFRLIGEIFSFFSKKRKIQLTFNLFLLTINAFFELISIYITLSLFSKITEPEKLVQNSFLEFIFGSSYNNFDSQIYYISFTFIVIILISTFLRLFNLRYSTYLAQNIGTDFCTLAFKSFLSQNYNFHLGKNSSDIISSINRNVDGTITAIDSFFQLISSLIISLAIFLGLYNIDPAISLIAIILLAAVYLVLNFYSRRVFLFNSKKLVDIQPLRLKFIQEGLGAIREVILYDLQKYYVKYFDKYDRDIRLRLARNGFIMGSIRFIIEGFILVAIAVLIIIFNSSNNNYNNLAILATFGIGAQKLLPSLQNIYRMWSNVLSKKYQLIDALNIFNLIIEGDNFSDTQSNIFKKSIKFKNIKFNYPNSREYVLDLINFEILNGDCIGVIGESGSGKTTFIRILMTLLRPTKGKLYIDNVDLFKYSNRDKLKKWRHSISHVPQDIFISDSTFAENIAFGIPYKDINFEKVKNAAQQAQLHSFINKLPQKYNTLAGEGGSKLSGGQRQRLAIARALYRQSKIIILDEATSSLDIKTENSILALINQFKGKITFIIIAHKLNTLSICDKILKIKSGSIESIIKPSELNI